MKIYAIYDKQHEIHGPMFEAINDELAGRIFTNIKENPESQIHKYPQDYKLVKLAEYDKKTGEIRPHREGLN